MVRGRRKCARILVKTESGSQENLTCTAPKKRDSKLSKGVRGKLSHSSPQVNDMCITKYFQPVSPEVVVKQENETEQNGLISRTSPRRSPPGRSEDGVDEKPVIVTSSPPQTPHKIQLCSDVQPLSPSSAMSQLRISLTPKKAVKSRRRLNPSQAVNQQAPKPLTFNGPKCNAPLKPPVAENHKLTEYFPVRRSVRKTKRTVLEEWQRGLEEAVASGKEDGLAVHNFEGKGRGIVTTRMFSKGEYVVEYAGELIDMAEAKERERLYAQDQNTGCYMYYFRHKNNQYCVDATAESGRLGRLVNHSRNGNLLTKTVVIKNEPHLVLIAKEDIRVGEEVTYDYGDRSKESIRYHPWLLS
ncbi:histone-lysine N-methyltransferase Set8 [Anabrus simplex]|uniref:histone-lysine N-methyltransferase Set8 n=1 Tax=Anabrus simplex TaxID=316456 RepID=UPI0035A2B445